MPTSKKRTPRRPPQRRPAQSASRRTVRPAPEPNVPSAFEPVVGSAYPQLLRHQGFSPLRSVLGVLLALILYVLVVSLMGNAVTALGWQLQGRPVALATYSDQALAFERPVGMVGANLGIAALIVVTMLVTVLVHQSHPRYLSSVVGRLRRPYLLATLGLAAVVFGATVVLGLVTQPGQSLHPEPHFVAFLVVIVVTSPLQAAGEEFLFRGYLMQALGSLARSPWVGAVLSSLIFTALHSTWDPSLLVNRFAFGMLAAGLVIKTGGLEAGIAAHVVNNLLAFGAATLTSSVAAARSLTTVSWAQTGQQVVAYAVFAVLAWLLARRWRLRTSYGTRVDLP